MRHRVAARLATALALVCASLLWGSPAGADVPGFEAAVGEAPAAFTAGERARTVTAVVSTDRGRRCQKVRWSLVLRTEGVSLDQIRVTRVEQDRSFEVNAQADGNAARVTDARLDPGQLCRGRTVTGRWDVRFTGPDDGSVTLEAQAADVTGRVLASAGTSIPVVSQVAARPTPTPSKSPTPSPSPSPSAEETAPEEAAAEETPAGQDRETEAAALDRTSSTPSLLGPGLIIGGLFVFLGVGLLLRLRSRARRDASWASDAQTLPTGFTHLPRRRSS